MIDLHSHILPGLDDGARDLETSLAMARMALDSGVTVMAATPHCGSGEASQVLEAWQLLRDALRDNAIPLALLPGMEIFATPDTPRMLAEGSLLTLNNSRYPLVEFSFRSDGEEETQILHRLLEAGYRPVVAHPERYEWLQRDPRLLNRWHRMGCLLQINRGSLLGRFGSRAADLALALVDRGFAAAVASDAHGCRTRTPWMADAAQLLEEEFSPLCRRTLLYTNPGTILKNQELPPVTPEWFD